MPRFSETIKICSQEDAHCYEKIKLAIESSYNDTFSCNCIPGCFSLSYSAQISMSKFNVKGRIKEPALLKYNSSFLRYLNRILTNWLYLYKAVKLHMEFEWSISAILIPVFMSAFIILILTKPHRTELNALILNTSMKIAEIHSWKCPCICSFTELCPNVKFNFKFKFQKKSHLYDFSKNVAMVDIFYDESFARRNVKNQFVGFTDFLCKWLDVEKNIQ